jgi:Zn-dependent protease with chaperone function
MEVPEFKAVLRHEFAHLSNRDTAWGSFTYSMSRSLLAAWKATPGGNPFKANNFMTGVVRLNPAWWVYWLFVRLFFRSTAGFSRVREITADWEAISYAGGACFGGGLSKVIVNEHALRTWMKETDVEPDKIPSVTSSVAGSLAQLTADEQAEFEATALAERGPDSRAYDTHPDAQTRLDYARRAGGEAPACAVASVKDLLDDWDALDASASKALLAPDAP